MLIEPSGVINTGDVVSNLTSSIDSKLGSFNNIVKSKGPREHT